MNTNNYRDLEMEDGKPLLTNAEVCGLWDALCESVGEPITIPNSSTLYHELLKKIRGLRMELHKEQGKMIGVNCILEDLIRAATGRSSDY